MTPLSRAYQPEPFYAERLCLTCARAIGPRGVYISDSACYCRRCAEYVKTAIENALRETA